MPKYEAALAAEIEAGLDLILEALADEDDDDTAAPLCICAAMSETQFEKGHYLEGLMWRAIAGNLRDHAVTVAQFRTMTRHNLEKLARQS